MVLPAIWRHDGVRLFARYLAFQVPSWLAVGLALFVARALGWIESPWWGLVLVALVAKDLALYPWLRIAHEPTRLHGPESLRDAVAVVHRALDPEGSVHVGAELWRARCVGVRCPVRAGDRVRVLGVEGLTLLVEPAGN
jgi:membrane protein implicated in regulation of membrane protease activity